MIGKTNSVIVENEQFKLIPKEYQPVEYIESDGDTYIDTKLPGHSNMSCKLKFSFVEVPNDGCLVGIRHKQLNSMAGKRLYFYHYYNGHKIGYGKYLSNKTTLAEKDIIYNVKTRLDQKKQYMYVNDVLVWNADEETYIENEETFYIFALNDNNLPYGTDENTLSRSITYFVKARLYFCMIWDGDALVRNFIPVYKIDSGEIGLFDIIEQRFYTNSGGGTFLKGNDIELKDTINTSTKI